MCDQQPDQDLCQDDIKQSAAQQRSPADTSTHVNFWSEVVGEEPVSDGVGAGVLVGVVWRAGVRLTVSSLTPADFAIWVG